MPRCDLSRSEVTIQLLLHAWSHRQQWPMWHGRQLHAYGIAGPNVALGDHDAHDSSVAAIRSFWKLSIWMQGLRRPVISTTALAPRCNRVPVGKANRSTPDVVMFSPSSPGLTAKPLARNSSNSSA